MLGIGKLAVGQQAYYVDLVRGADEYYTGVAEEPGCWLGHGAAILGLDGPVTPAALSQILAGVDPTSGTDLLGRAVKVPGFDLTFKAPKSVSLLFGLGDRSVPVEVRAAHDRAVTAALGWLEPEAVFARRGHAGADIVAGDGLVAAGFAHHTSRAGDPHLHSHAVVANMTRGPDGRWTALDARHLYRAAKTAGTIYETQLRFELTRRLGVRWGPVRNGIADLAGVDRSVIDAFSTRRHQIEAHLDMIGAHTARAADVAALATRQPKDPDVRMGDLVPGWRSKAARLGLDRETVESLTDGPRLTSRLASVEIERLFDRLAGPDGLTARRSGFARNDVVQAVANSAARGIDVTEIVATADRFLDNPRLVLLTPGVAGEQRWTTTELLAVEQHLLTGATTQRSKSAGVVSDRSLEKALAAYPNLGADQQQMVRALVTGGGGIKVVVGPAGTGKTRALAAAHTAWTDGGVRVLGCALAARAAAELQAGSGIRSMTIDRLLGELADPHTGGLAPGSALVVDEAAMVGTRQLAALADHAARADALLVLVGDDRQLPSIDAGGVFAALAARVEPVRLEVNRRQHAGWEQDALGELRAGQVHTALAAYTDHHRIKTGVSVADVRRQLIDDWAQARNEGNPVLMLATRRADVDALNLEARLRLRADGQLGADILQVGFAIGDDVLALRNDHRLGLLNGTRATVTSSDCYTLTVRTSAGEQVTVGADYLQAGHLGHGYAMTVHKSQGVTTGHTFLLADDTLYREAGYVALSRGRNTNTVYLPAPIVDDDDSHTRQRKITAEPSDLARTLVRSRAQQSATDQLPARLPGDTIAELAARRHQLDQRPEPDPFAERVASDTRGWTAELDNAVAARQQAEQHLAGLDQPQREADPAQVGLDELQAAVEREHRARVALDQLAAYQPVVDAEHQRLEHWQTDRDDHHRQTDQIDRAIKARTVALGNLALADPPAHLVAVLGPAPRDPARRQTWAETAGRIQAHRERWDITDRHHAFGPTTADSRTPRDQERRLLERDITQARQQLSRTPQRHRDHGMTLDC